jgi:uncharacterized protein YjgD (DUF1641 family)
MFSYLDEEEENIKKPLNPMVLDYLSKKNGLMGPPKELAPVDPREVAQNQYDEQLDRSNIASFASNIGDVIAGNRIGSNNKYFQDQNALVKENTLGKLDAERKRGMEDATFKNQQLDAKIKQDQFDPNSQSSINFRNSLKTNFPKIAATYGDKFDSISAGDQDLIFKPLQLQEQINARKQQAAIAAQGRQDALNAKNTEKKEKKNLAVVEIQDRYNNMKDSISSLRKMVEDNGTTEILGPENAQMDQYITSIATDMAKLVDPASVARESEVESFKKMLFSPGFWQRKSSVDGVLNNFEQMVDKRLDNAYSVRGLQNPNSRPKTNPLASNPKKVIQNGHEYILNEETGQYE